MKNINLKIKKKYYSIYNPNSLSIIPAVIYPNAEKQKLQIYKENRHKSGIYRWTNLKTKESYIGSSINLTKRFYSYYSKKSLKSKKSLIYRAIKDYKHSNFSLEILEFFEKFVLIEREQYYIDWLKPEYNIKKIVKLVK